MTSTLKEEPIQRGLEHKLAKNPWKQNEYSAMYQREVP